MRGSNSIVGRIIICTGTKSFYFSTHSCIHLEDINKRNKIMRNKFVWLCHKECNRLPLESPEPMEKTDENQIAMTWKNLHSTTKCNIKIFITTTSHNLFKTKKGNQRHRNIKPTKITTNCQKQYSVVVVEAFWYILSNFNSFWKIYIHLRPKYILQEADTMNEIDASPIEWWVFKEVKNKDKNLETNMIGTTKESVQAMPAT